MLGDPKTKYGENWKIFFSQFVSWFTCGIPHGRKLRGGGRGGGGNEGRGIRGKDEDGKYRLEFVLWGLETQSRMEAAPSGEFACFNTVKKTDGP